MNHSYTTNQNKLTDYDLALLQRMSFENKLLPSNNLKTLVLNSVKTKSFKNYKVNVPTTKREEVRLENSMICFGLRKKYEANFKDQFSGDVKFVACEKNKRPIRKIMALQKKIQNNSSILFVIFLDNISHSASNTLRLQKNINPENLFIVRKQSTTSIEKLFAEILKAKGPHLK